MRPFVLFACALALLAASATAGAQPAASRSWAAPQIKTVVEAGLLAPSVGEFRPNDPLTEGELGLALYAFGIELYVDEPFRRVSLRELDAQLVAAAGLRAEAQNVRFAARYAGLQPNAWFGTETVARLLGLRLNHPKDQEHLELQPTQPATRAEAAYSIARLLELEPTEVEQVRETTYSFAMPWITELQKTLVKRAAKLVGSPYVWAGTSERPQTLAGKRQPGGFDCSGLVWRVFKLEPVAGVPALATALKGRTTYEMSAEGGRGARIPRERLQPADIVFFGDRGPRSKPSEIGHMGIYVGNGWMVHSSDRGTTLTPMTGWYATRFAWGRNVLAEVAKRAPAGR